MYVTNSGSEAVFSESVLFFLFQIYFCFYFLANVYLNRSTSNYSISVY